MEPQWSVYESSTAAWDGCEVSVDGDVLVFSSQREGTLHGSRRELETANILNGPKWKVDAHKSSVVLDVIQSALFGEIVRYKSWDENLQVEAKVTAKELVSSLTRAQAQLQLSRILLWEEEGPTKVRWTDLIGKPLEWELFSSADRNTSDVWVIESGQFVRPYKAPQTGAAIPGVQTHSYFIDPISKGGLMRLTLPPILVRSARYEREFASSGGGPSGQAFANSAGVFIPSVECGRSVLYSVLHFSSVV